MMRRLWLGCAVLGMGACVGAGCNADVPGTSGFGSGGQASGATGGPQDGTGPGSSDNPSQGGDASASSAAETEGGSDTAPGTGPQDTDGESETGTAVTQGDSDDGGASASSGVDTSEAEGSSGEAEDTEAGTDSDSDSGSDSGAGGETDPCGFLLDGPWLEIEYWQSGVPATSPSWAYSDTPGWGEDQWAAQNASWPEMWDLYQNINVVDDPIGVVAVVGSSAQLQLMLGFEELIAYDSATLCIEGRSVSAVSSVQFDAYNPLTGWGNSAMMAHDWEVHAVGLELGQPFEVGGGVQAIRLDTTGGSSSLGVQRMRLILHGAVY